MFLHAADEGTAACRRNESVW